MATIKITALRHSAFYTPLLMTMAAGFLKQEGLDAEYIPATDPGTVTDSLRRGEFHVSQSAVATSFAELEQGINTDVVHFAQINCRDGFYIASREQQPEFKWQDLKGKKVLVDHFFQPLAMLRYGLHRQGIKLDDLEVIDAGDVVAIEKTFREGIGDFVHMQGPTPQQLEHDGLACVVASVGEAVGPVAFSSLCASREWLQSDMARAFMRAYRKSLEYTVTVKAADIARQQQAAGFLPDIDTTVLAHTIAAYQELGTWKTDPVIGKQEYETLLDVFIHTGAISKHHAYEAAVVLPPDV